MKDIIKMWGNTRMIVLAAISAAVYATVLVWFKWVQLVPGLADFRPAAALPPLCSILFGPAGAWGAAFGNLIGDFFGMLGPGSIPGFIGNFLYAYIPYKFWESLSGGEIEPRKVGTWIRLEAGFLFGSVCCGVFIGWGVDILGLVPFKVLANVIVIQDCLFSMIISPFLVFIFYPMMKNWGLVYRDLLYLEDKKENRAIKITGLMFIVIGAAGGLIIGNLVSFGIIDLASFAGAASSVRFALIPFIILILTGCAML